MHTLTKVVPRLLFMFLLAFVSATLSSARQVELSMQGFCCDKTTEAGADEVYILVYGRSSNGQTYEARIPGPQHWDMNDGNQPDDNPSGDSHCIHNKSLFVGELPDGGSWDLLVMVMEEDNGDSSKWQKAVSKAAISSGNPYAVVGGAILAAYTELFGGIIHDTDDYIGSYAVHIANGQISWKPVDRVVHVIPWGGSDSTNPARREVRMNGDGSNYVGWYQIKG
jgi:hypothetical protein